jgi:Domain of unknown function (DUF4157)
MAEAVMRMPGLALPAGEMASPPIPPFRMQRTCAPGAKDELLRRKADEGAAEQTSAPPIVHEVLRSSGQPIDDAPRATFEPRFGFDFSKIRIYADERAAESARTVGALAYTVGPNVVFGRGQYQPHTEAGQKLLAHELAHVVQQHGATSAPMAQERLSQPHDPHEREADNAASSVLQGHRVELGVSGRPPALQMAIEPEDVSGEMVGREFELLKSVSAAGMVLAAGTIVRAMSWNNSSQTVMVEGMGTLTLPLVGKIATRVPASVPKKDLRPHHTAVAGVNPYGAGVDNAARLVEKGESDLAAWDAQKAKYRTPHAQGIWNTEHTRLEGLLTTRGQQLNRRLIQGTMFNRFDAIIRREVDAANAAHGLRGADKLDPNLFKAMLFQESQLGTSGQHMSDPPTHPVKTRFNLAQVIDSSALALFTLIEREHTAMMTTFHLTQMRTDLAHAQNDLAALNRKRTRTPADNIRLGELRLKSHQSWETFIWEYKETGSSVGFADAVAALFASASRAQNLDYEFWIHIAVLWLFEKKKAGMTWAQAIEAYNGSGVRAAHYREAVVRRAGAAAAAAGRRREFVPDNI